MIHQGLIGRENSGKSLTLRMFYKGPMQGSLPSGLQLDVDGPLNTAKLVKVIEEDLCIKLDPREVLDTWRSAATPDDRLNAVQSLFDRILDDGEIDLLTGSVGADAFIRGDLDRMVDRTRDDLIVVP